MTKNSIVLLGVGHTNAHVVREWKDRPIAGCSLTCVSRFDTATYSGMLPGTLGKQYDDGEMRIDLKALCERSGVQLITAETNNLDLDAGELHFEDHEPVSFDALSIGVGSIPAGRDDHHDAASLVPIKPMQTFLKRLNDRMETVAGSPGNSIKIAVVGGGVASVEIALCLKQRCERHDDGPPVSIDIFTGGDSVAQGMSARSIARIEHILQTREIRVMRGQRVTDVADGSVSTEDGVQHEAHLVIWSTGATAPPVLGKLNLETDDTGFVATRPTLQSISDPRIFAVGDAGTVLASPAPKAGVYAVRQCPILWHNLRAFFEGGAMKPFHPQSDFLKLLNTGDDKAFLEYGSLTAHARWCWHLKTWIDRRFVKHYQCE